MKKYRNERHGFEILIPTDWFPIYRPEIGDPFGESLLFCWGTEENFNMIIGIEVPEMTLEQNEEHFIKFAEKRDYSIVSIGRINVCGKDHLCAAYIQPNNIWTKKYMIVFDETEYATTAMALCSSRETFLEYEKRWDTIVKSFKIMPHIRPVPINEREKVLNARIYFEHGYNLFKSCKYEEAIQQFEKGKTMVNYLPGNYFGIAATIMQMIEKNLIPKDQIRKQLIIAEKNIIECLRISPNERDYLDVYKAIVEEIMKTAQ